MAVTVKMGNNAVSRLASSLTSGATSLSVTTGEGTKFPALSAGQWFPLTLVASSGALEILRCTARAGDVFTVTRAQESTAAQAFAAGDRVELRLTAAALAEISAAVDVANSYFAFRNKLINPKGNINQRAYVSAVATTIANQYTLDRWRVVTSGQNLTFAASGNGFVMTAPAGGVEQVIEGANIEGGTYRLSWTGTATAKVNGTTIANGALTASLTANADVTVTFAGGTFEKPQFELNNITPFEDRFKGLELSLCQRYYATGGYRYDGYGGAGTYQTTPVVFPVSMRATPTIVDTHVSQINCTTGPSQVNVSAQGFSSGRSIVGSAGSQYIGTYTASAEL